MAAGTNSKGVAPALELKTVQRRIPRVVQSTLVKKTTPTFSKGDTVFISEDAEGLATSLRQRFLDNNINATLITSPEDLDPACDGFIFLSALRDYGNIIEAAEMNRTAFAYTKRIAASFSEADSKGVLVLVQDTGGYFSFDLDGDPVKAPLGGFAGLAKTANQEWPNATARSIDLDAGYRNPGVLADTLFEEIQYGQGVEVGLPEDSRIVINCVDETILSEAKNTDRINTESVVLASGGARGVTAACLIELAKNTSASFALLGRSPLVDEPDYLVNSYSDAELKKGILDAAKKDGVKVTLKDLTTQSNAIQRSREIRDTLSKIESHNSKVKYYVSDVTDVEKLFTTCAQIRTELGSITALVHGAGVLADKAIKDKSIDDFDWVFRTKVDGFFALNAATAADPIDTICIFSSVAGRFGNVGQADYAMANEVLNKIAWSEKKHREDCVVKSLAWGPWGGGMVTPGLQKMFEARGISVIDINAGAKQFVDELLVDPDDIVEVVLGAGLAKKKDSRKTISIRTSPFLRDHAVNTKVVLPMVIGVEWILENSALKLSVPKTNIELQNIEVRKGILLSENSDLQIEVKSENKKGNLSVELHSNALAYRTIASVRKQAPSKPTIPVLPIWNGEIYDGKILFHGPEFHFLNNMSRPDGDLIVAEISPPKTWTRNFSIDVQGLDAALQVGVIAANAKTNGYVVPTSIQSFSLISDKNAASIIGTLVSSDKIAAVYDFLLLDDNQDITAALSGCRFQVYG